MCLTEVDRKLKIQANNLQLVHQLITDFQKTMHDVVFKMHHKEKKMLSHRKKKVLTSNRQDFSVQLKACICIKVYS